MPIDRSDILAALARLQLPDGGDLVSRDFIRAVVVEGEAVRFVIEAPTPEIAHKLADIRAAAEQIVMQPADDYVADFVAGISRLKVVHADAVMQSIEAYVAAQGPLPSDLVRVPAKETLSALMNIAIETDKPIIVSSDGRDIGLITRADLLRTVIEGTEIS